MRHPRVFPVLALLAAVMGLARPLAAQGPPPGKGGPQATVTSTPAEVIFPSPTHIEFDLGWLDHGSALVVTVEPKNKNRQDWQLFVQAGSADMGGYGKPVEDILVRAEGSSDWTPLNITASPVAEGSGAGTVTLFFRLVLDWTRDGPGTYATPVELTAVTR